MSNYQTGEVAFHVTERSIVVSSDGSKGIIRKSDGERFDKALKSIRDNDMDTLKELSIAGFDIAKYSHMEIYVYQGKLYRFGEEVTTTLSNTIMKLKNDGLPYDYLLKFWDRLKNNPEPSSIEQLHTFLMANDIPITSEGYIMGYKSVQQKNDGFLYDHYTGLVRYDLHKTVKMDRDQVECDPQAWCGRGLHIGSYKYVNKFYDDTSVVLEVLVDPCNVISVPIDRNCQKCRCCELFVSAICGAQTKEAIYNPPKKAKKALAEKDETIGKKSSSQDTKIGRYFYDKKSISSKRVAEKTDESNKNPYSKLVKSDFPLFFQRLHVKEVYRQRNGKSSNYIGGQNGVYIIYKKRG